MTTNDAALENFIAHSEIRNLLAKIANLADTGTPEEYIECFSEEPTWELTAATGLPIPATVITGRDNILKGVLERREANLQGPGSYTAHAISTTSINVINSSAQASSLFMYYTNINETPRLVAVGRYQDSLLRDTAGKWVLHRRVITRE